MTVVTPVMNAASTHKTAMMPTMMPPGRVNLTFRHRPLGSRRDPIGGPGRLGGYRGKAQTRENQGQQKLL
jgi:hypothetical protein